MWEIVQANLLLSLHQRIHTGARQYKCSKCGNFFSQNFVLIYPWRSHIGEVTCVVNVYSLLTVDAS